VVVPFPCDSNDLPCSISFVLEVEWLESGPGHAVEEREEGIQMLHWAKSDTVMFAPDSASVYCFHLEDGRHSHGP
jgi:hypothetical protein